MLIAEIHGHLVPEALNSEDYLTSAVFGHLRYLLPNIFWPELFAKMQGMSFQEGVPDSDTLLDVLTTRGVEMTQFEQLDVLFWASHRLFGVPDLILCFTAPEKPALVVLIEAKLWSDKSGTDDSDQIARYFQLLDQPDALRPQLPHDFFSAVVYLTPRESRTELEESIAACPNPSKARKAIFRLQWQDIVEAARQVLPRSNGNTRLILDNVIKFLSRRGLEYFSGFRKHALIALDLNNLKLFHQGVFQQILLPSEFQVKCASWGSRTP